MPTKAAKLVPAEVTRSAARRELEIYLDALCHDQQYAIRRACYLLEVLALPKRLPRALQLKQLWERLAIHREELAANPRQQWIGRPWTVRQLTRTFYAKPGFRRRPPMPVTREELEAYEPTVVAPKRKKVKRG